jgi:hypothetical protein
MKLNRRQFLNRGWSTVVLVAVPLFALLRAASAKKVPPDAHNRSTTKGYGKCQYSLTDGCQGFKAAYGGTPSANSACTCGHRFSDHW